MILLKFEEDYYDSFKIKGGVIMTLLNTGRIAAFPRGKCSARKRGAAGARGVLEYE